MPSPQPSSIRVGRRYRANRLDGPYDVLVIGSGIGGLCAAACLSKLGKKVAVFEQHYTAGGFTHSYERNGYEWDVGVHYIGDMGARHYLYGGYYPVGGASEIARNVIPVIQQSGGEVFTYADVTNILIENGRAVGVRLADGHEERAPTVISDAGVFNTFTGLLPDTTPQHAAYRKQLGQVRRAMASACLYIGLNDTAENLGLPKTNYWIYPDNDYEGQLDRALADPDHHDIPLTYISFPSAKDPDFTRRYPGRATIEIVAAAPFEWYQRWADAPWGKRGEDYEAKKEAFSQRLLEKLFEKHPHLRDHLDYYELSTPLSTAHFCRYPEGEIYGLDHDPERFEQDWLRPKTKVPGLYLTGQDILTCGVGGALVGGLMTTLAISGRRGLPLAKRMLV